VLDQLAVCFARLHQVELDGFGRLTPDGAGVARSWAFWLWADFNRLREALAAGGHPLGERADLIDVAIANARAELETRPARLVHGDLGDGEVYIDPESALVTGVADWGKALAADPLYEFSRFCAGGPVDDDRPGRFLPHLTRRYSELTNEQGFAHTWLVDLYDAHNAMDNAVWSLVEAPSWIDPLCARAVALLERAASR
jgi:aminoglycoside phosphotransferase (APT) family kinase protein